MSITIFYENAGCRLAICLDFFIVFKPKNKNKTPAGKYDS